MNIEIANRLVELRKKNGLSQEELADKLGLSRQAISKWERAEASPDTDNLICLAKLYNLSLDELVSSSASIKEKEEDRKDKEAREKEDEDEIEMDELNSVYIESEDGDTVSISPEGIYVKDGEDSVHIKGGRFLMDKIISEKRSTKAKNKETVSAWLWGISISLFTLAYITLGVLLEGGWAQYWPLFFFAPLIPSAYEAIHKKRLSSFLYPLLVTGVYSFLGTLLNLWHPYWFLFLTIPLYYAISSPIDKLMGKKENDEEEAKDEDN